MLTIIILAVAFCLNSCDGELKEQGNVSYPQGYRKTDTMYPDLNSIDTSIIRKNNSAADMVIASSFILLGESEKLESDSADEVIRIHRIPTFGKGGRNDQIQRIEIVNGKVYVTSKTYQLIGVKPACIVQKQLLDKTNSITIRNSLTTFGFWEQPVQLTNTPGSFDSYLYILTGLKQKKNKPDKTHEIYRYSPLDSITASLLKKIQIR